MSDPVPAPKRVHPLHSLFFKCTFMVAVCVLIVVAVIEARNTAAMNEKAIAVIQDRAVEVTDLLAMQMGGSIKFGNSEAVTTIVESVYNSSGRDIQGIVVLSATGDLLYQSEGLQELGLLDDLTAVAQQSLTDEAMAGSADGMISAIPSRFGGADAVVGSVATYWTTKHALADLAAARTQTLMLALGVFLVALFCAGLFLRTRMSQPLIALEEAMGKVAAEDYETDVPSIGRKDEIGQMAERLNAFRNSLSLAKEQQAEAVLKGAAFEGSSAAMMMVDPQGIVLSVNPAATRLIESLSPDIREIWPGVSAEAVVGSDLSDVEVLRRTLAECIDKATSDGSTELRSRVMFNIGSRILRVATSPATDSEGNLFGCVVEWADRTRSEKDASLIAAMNASQASVTFDASGKVSGANENFLTLIGGAFEDTAKCSLARMFAGNLDNDPSGTEFVRRVMAGEISHGRFDAYSVHADTTYVLEGSFSVTTDVNGKPDSVTFLGLDVSEQQRQIKEAEESRLRAAQEQNDVVGLLGVALNRLADGDLMCDINDQVPPAYTKLRDDFNATVSSLRDAILMVTHNSDSIRNETAEITSAADDLSRRTEKQAATLEETAAALDELTVSVRSAAEGADDASKMSAEAQNNAVQGGEIARQAVTAMDGIKNSSQEISKITSVIDDIAFQTNLLALNAGVEAARAGEAGRGFAVVATEVRALAQRSSDAAREINELISSSGEQVQLGVDLVDRTGKALGSIVTSVSEISERVSTIAASSREQSSGLAEINTAVNELDHVTQQNAAMFEETTAASHALTSEADALVGAVARFKVGGPGSSRAAPAVSKPIAAPPSAVAAPMSQGSAAVKVDEEPVSDGWEEF